MSQAAPACKQLYDACECQGLKKGGWGEGGCTYACMIFGRLLLLLCTLKLSDARCCASLGAAQQAAAPVVLTQTNGSFLAKPT